MIKKHYTPQKVGKVYALVANGSSNVDLNNMIELNPSAAYIWNNTPKYFDVKDMAQALMTAYNVNLSTAMADCQELAQIWINAGVCRE